MSSTMRPLRGSETPEATSHAMAGSAMLFHSIFFYFNSDAARNAPSRQYLSSFVEQFVME